MKKRLLALVMLFVMVFTCVPPMTVMAEETDQNPVVEITELTLNKTTLSLAMGGTSQLSVTNATDIEIVWTTSDETIATVDQNGNVTAIADGIATISATFGELVANCEITVVTPVITLPKNSIALYIGGKYQIVPQTENYDGTITYSSSNPSIATVDESGYVKAIAAGKATITVGGDYCQDQFLTVNVVNKKLSTPAPTIARTASGIKVSWKKITGASKYEVWRKVNSGSWTKVKTTTTLSYTDTNISYNKTYSYKIKAVGTSSGLSRASSYSSIVKRTVNSILKPASVSAISVGYKSIKISWSRVYPATGYEVYRATSSNGPFKKIATISSGSTLSYKDTDLTTGKTYYYKVKAKSGSVKSAYSTKVSAKPIPAAPIMKTSASSTSSTITVKWNKVTGANGYYVYRRTSTSKSWTKIATITSSSTLSYKDKKRNGKYYYSVIAYRNVNGKKVAGKRSESVRLSTLKTPTITVTQYNDQFKNRVRWDPVIEATAYQVYRKKGSSGEWEYVTTTTSASYVSSVTHGVYYYWKVRPIYKSTSATTYGAFSEVKEFIISYAPNYSVSVTSVSGFSVTNMSMNVTNYGNYTLRIYSKEACYVDINKESNCRDLYLVDSNSKKVSYIDIKPGQTKTIKFSVKDKKSTKYSSEGFICYKFRYDGIYYYGVSSSYYGSAYDYY